MNNFVSLQLQHTSERAHFRKAVRATLILFPLLGVTNLLFFYNPKNGTHDKLYMLFNASMQSSQGIFLAVLYCFCNSEVQDVARRHFRRVMARKEARRSALANSSRYMNSRRKASSNSPAATTNTTSTAISNARFDGGGGGRGAPGRGLANGR